MTPAETDRFIKAQLNMGARIAQKANRARIGAAAFTNVKGPTGASLGDRIIAALDRPGVAPSSRPISKAGTQTFHFALTTVSRTSDFAAKMKNDVPGKAGDHMGYVEREGAAETVDPEIRREADAIDREAWAVLGGQAYIERPDAAEVMPDGRTLASFGNIARTIDDRIEFWRALEEAAAKPKTHGIITDRTVDPAFWRQVDNDPSAPSTLRSAPPWMALPLPEDAPDSKRLNTPIAIPRVSDKEAIAVAQYAAKHRSRAKHQKPAVGIDPGRGGRIQNRIIVELPHELTSEARLKVAEAFCHKHFVEGREKPLPHWCVIHKPDHHNDSRNTHMHIVFAERAASRMKHPETGVECWDFEIQLKVKDNAKHIRLKRPFEQAPDRSLQDRSWVKKARKSYADIANAALAAAGKSKIYDERTYKAMGINVDPRKRINGKDYIKEKQGVSTKAGTPAVLEQWRREEARLAERHPSLEPDPEIWGAFTREIKRWAHSSTSTKFKLMYLRNEWNVAQAHRRYYAAEAAANAFIMRKIRSKLAPPLGTDAQTTKDVTAYLKIFKTDLIDKHGEAAKQWQRNERYMLTSLKQAQRADPKTAKTDAFLDGSSITKAMAGMMTDAAMIAASNPTQTLTALSQKWIARSMEDVREERAIVRAMEAVEKARAGSIEPYPQKLWDDAAKTNVHAPGTPAAAAAGPLREPAPETVPTWRPIASGRVEITPTPTAKPSPAPLVRVGDEVPALVMSDTGAPVQRRTYSPSSIAEAKLQAAAMIAAAEKRRAEREATSASAKASREKFESLKAYLANPEEWGAARNPKRTRSSAPQTTSDPPRNDAAEAQASPGMDRAAVALSNGTPPAASRTADSARTSPAAQTASSTAVDAAPIDRPPVVARTGNDGALTRSRTQAPVQAGPVRSTAADPTPTTAGADVARPSQADQRPPRAEPATQRFDPAAKPTPEPTRPSVAPLLGKPTTVYAPATPPLDTTSPRSDDPKAAKPPHQSTIDIADIEVTDAPPKKKKPVLTPEQLRQRALLAAKDRGRGR